MRGRKRHQGRSSRNRAGRNVKSAAQIVDVTVLMHGWSNQVVNANTGWEQPASGPLQLPGSSHAIDCASNRIR